MAVIHRIVLLWNCGVCVPPPVPWAIIRDLLDYEIMDAVCTKCGHPTVHWRREEKRKIEVEGY